MAAARKKSKSDETPVNLTDEKIRKLEKERDELVEKIDKSAKRAGSEGSGFLTSGGLAAAAFVADWMICGGVLSLFAVASGADFLTAKGAQKRAKKRLAKIEDTLSRVYEVRAKADAEQEAKLKSQKNLKADFSAEAQKEIDNLKEQIQKLQEQINPPRKKIDKGDSEFN